MDLTLPESQEPEISLSLGHFIPKNVNMGTSLVVQWLGLQALKRFMGSQRVGHD